jgi:TATA-box binding protein (TBP) (component of TFIID and TFIIIB)
MNCRITNICAKFDCNCKLDLVELYIQNYIDNPFVLLKYDPHKFPGLRIRLLNSKTTVLVFSSGYISIVGGKSHDNVME